MERQSLIDEKQKITLADEKSGVLKVDLIQVVGRGGRSEEHTSELQSR